jgi:hypothetical protein
MRTKLKPNRARTRREMEDELLLLANRLGVEAVGCRAWNDGRVPLSGMARRTSYVHVPTGSARPDPKVSDTVLPSYPALETTAELRTRWGVTMYTGKRSTE